MKVAGPLLARLRQSSAEAEHVKYVSRMSRLYMAQGHWIGHGMLLPCGEGGEGMKVEVFSP